jgi:hypothetical protein
MASAMVGYFSRPVVAAAREDVHSARIEPGVHPVAVEFQLVKPVGAIRCLLNQCG